MGHNFTNPNQRRGINPKDGSAHENDHLQHSRRGFLRNLGLFGAGSLVLNKMPLQAIGMSPFAAALNASENDRALVFIRLKGGNDGLNTFIPIHDFGRYMEVRPDIHIPRNEAIDLTSTLAMHPMMNKLEPLWNDGKMRVVQNVGYPNQNLSHFRSSDIWATTSDADEIVSSGVLGRYLEDQYPNFLSEPPTTPPAIQIGGPGNLLFNNQDDFNYAISTENPTQLYEIARRGRLYDVETLPECSYGEQLGYVRAVANTTFRYAGVLAEAFERGRNDAEYDADRLGLQLALVARLLRGGLGTRLFVVEINGFDTHANQPDAHARLLKSVSDNVAAFFEDLEMGGIDREVLAMTFSEFGRRVNQNGSMGTDHGAAAPVMLFGPALEGNGVAGGLPNMESMDSNFNLPYQVDFRSIYATILSRWLCIPGDAVDGFMGATFPRMDELGLFCETSTSVADEPARESLAFKAYVNGNNVVLEYELPSTAKVGVSFYDATGRRLSAPFKGQRNAGVNQQRFNMAAINWSSGVYVVSLEVNGRAHSRKVGLFR